MQVDISSVLLFLIAVSYLIMLPGYVLILALRVTGLDLVETLTVSFGVGIGVLAALSTVLSLTAGIGLTFPSLIITNTAFLAVVGFVIYIKSRPKEVMGSEQDNTQGV